MNEKEIHQRVITLLSRLVHSVMILITTVFVINFGQKVFGDGLLINIASGMTLLCACRIASKTFKIWLRQKEEELGPEKTGWVDNLRLALWFMEDV